MAPPALPADYTAARDKLLAAKSKLEGLVAASVIDPVAVEAAVAEAASAQKEVETTRAAAQPKVPPKVAAEHTTEEAAIKAIVEDAAAKGDAAAGEKKKRKDEAKKKLMQEVAKASLLTGDVDVLSAVVKEGQDADMSAKDLAEGEAKLHEMQTFHVTLKAAADELRGAAKGIALEIAERAGGLEELEGKIKEHKEGAVALLNRVVVELYLGILTKAAPTAIATDALDASIQEATALGCDETLLKSMKKKKDEATKAQNAQKLADKKAKKPPKDPPKPPDKPEAHPTVEVLKTGLEEALAKAEAKLLEATASLTLKDAKKSSLLSGDVLLDLGERARDEVHPHIEALDVALKAAKEAKASDELIAAGTRSLEEGNARRKAARTALALSKLQAAAAAGVESCDVGGLGAAIAVAEAEEVEAEAVEKAKKHHGASFKAQSEGTLEPLSRPEELRHEGFAIIEPLKTALEEARKRGAAEDLLIKGQTKLDYWIEARARRDKAKKELDASLSPPPCTVDQPKVHACLSEASDAKLDPELLKAAAEKLKVAELAQRVYAKSKEPPGQLAIDVLQEELDEVGGEQLTIEQDKQSEIQKVVDHLKENIDLIKETKENQKMRDQQLAKQVKKGAHKQRPELHEDPLAPAWVRDDGEGGDASSSPDAGRRASLMTSVGAKQDEELKELEVALKQAEGELKTQDEVVKALTGTVVVPQDVVRFAQLKIKASRCCDEMQQAQLPKLLDLDLDRLKAAIKACEFKFGELPIAGLDELDCNVPKAELLNAKTRLKDADKAQKRQQRARSQLSVRVNAPTGTATFDMLVKLVAEAKAAEVEEDLIARAELKLKKMEELAASSLRAGPLAFVSFHLPCLQKCVSRYAISLVEQAEYKRRQDSEKQMNAEATLREHLGDWEMGQINKSLMSTDVEKLKAAIHDAAHEGCAQELINMGRQKLVAIEKYKIDKERGLIKDDDEEKKKKAAAAAAASGGDGAKKKQKFKNYGYVKKEGGE